MFATGVFTGLLANGGGFLIVPVYLLLFGLGMRQAAGTSLLVITVLAVPTLITHWALGHIDWLLAAQFTAGQVPGSAAGSQFAHHAQGTVTKRLHATVVAPADGWNSGHATAPPTIAKGDIGGALPALGQPETPAMIPQRHRLGQGAPSQGVWLVPDRLRPVLHHRPHHQLARLTNDHRPTTHRRRSRTSRGDPRGIREDEPVSIPFRAFSLLVTSMRGYTAISTRRRRRRHSANSKRSLRCLARRSWSRAALADLRVGWPVQFARPPSVPLAWGHPQQREHTENRGGDTGKRAGCQPVTGPSSV